jgi:hypothetical protein
LSNTDSSFEVVVKVDAISHNILRFWESTKHDSPKLITLKTFSIHQAMNVTRSHEDANSVIAGTNAIFANKQWH